MDMGMRVTLASMLESTTEHADQQVNAKQEELTQTGSIMTFIGSKTSSSIAKQQVGTTI